MKNLSAIILGGGQGARLYPLTKDRSKPAVPLAGKYRLIDIPISNCLNSDIRRIFVLTQFNSESLNRHIAQTYHFDMFTDGFVDILAAEQTHESRDWFQGTADAVRKCFRHFDTGHTSHLLILSGDQLYRMDYRDFFRFHLEKGADVTVAMIPVSEADVPGFGIMKVDRNTRIVDFVEKPPLDRAAPLRLTAEEIAAIPEKYHAVLNAKPYLASMGIYLFNTDVLAELLRSERFNDFGKDIIPHAIKNLNVYGYPFDGYWSDIGTIKSFYQANLELTKANPEFEIYDAAYPVYTHARFLPSSKIFRCQIHSSIVSEGCVLSGALVWNSILGIRSRVGSGTEIRDSMIMGADYLEDTAMLNENRRLGRPDIGIGNYCTIRRAILDKNVRIGNNVQILNKDNVQNFETDQYVVCDGIVIIPKNTVLPDNTVI
ncbi:MAG TPA: glucose-1-phosphate adenylyltransferase [Acidobacteriota bacterium]|nr:glucose-1-phosphate adenylyltransferase [Acidobacteriota bacterium]HQM64779.1 glucose-1-phosphate adenylyltransferase [Acidobacteriota bacterium]